MAIESGKKLTVLESVIVGICSPSVARSTRRSTTEAPCIRQRWHVNMQWAFHRKRSGWSALLYTPSFSDVPLAFCGWRISRCQLLCHRHCECLQSIGGPHHHFKVNDLAFGVQLY